MDDALDYVAAYTVANDVSARDGNLIFHPIFGAVALEEHFATSAIFDRTAQVPGPLSPRAAESVYPKLLELGEQRIAAMDAAGVDLQVISHTAPGLEHVVEGAAALAREANDVLLQAISLHPQRFAGFATLPVSDPAAAAEELRRCVALGMHGALVNGTVDGLFLDDPRFDDLLSAAEDLRVPLYLHPGVPPIAVREAYYSGFSDDVSRTSPPRPGAGTPKPLFTCSGWCSPESSTGIPGCR